MKTFLQQLFDYNYFCNKELIRHLSALETIPPASKTLFSHLLNAHHLWNARLMGTEPRHGVWDEHEPDRWEGLHYDNQRDTFELIQNTEQFERRVDYESTEGRNFSNTVQDILFHIINHSTHHRAQIATDLRTAGLNPLQLDYIFYKR